MRIFQNHHFFIFIFLLISSFLQGQTISYVQPDFFSVCDTAEFQIQISNSETATFTNLEVIIALPNGVEYSSGNACEATNLNAPVFCLDDLAVGESQIISFYAIAVCDAISTIDAGTLFCNTIIAQHDDGTVAQTADCYVIEKSLLVFTDVSQVFMTGTKNQILQRTITLRNTLDGPLSELTFIDAHQEGMIISSNQGMVISNIENTFELLLSADDFAQIGDGDGLFEKEDGPLTIIEFIEITTCGISAPLNSVSNISANYGCSGEVCQIEETLAYISFSPSTAAPQIEIIPTVNTPTCFCSNEGTQQVLQLINNGDEAATNLTIQLGHLLYEGGFYPESFKIDSAGIITDIIPINAPVLDIEACNFPGGMATSASIEIPILSAGDSLFILWDSYFCDSGNCSSRYSWEYELSYFKCCPQPENLFVDMEEPLLAQNSFLEFASEVEIIEGIPNDPPLLTDGELLTINYGLDTDLLLQTEGVFYLDFELPCDLEIQDNQNFEICGQVPNEFSNTIGDSITTYHLEYDLPIECDFTLPINLQFICDENCQEILCQDTIISSCPVAIDCAEAVEAGTNIRFFASLSTQNCPQDCGLEFCTYDQIAIECTSDVYCEEIINGYLDFDYAFNRLNSGQGDNDNDHLPDGAIDWNLANRYRAMTGDTLRSELRGQVNIDVAGTTFNYGHINLDMRTEGLTFALNGEIFNKETGLVPVETVLRIFDQSSNTYYDCEPTLLPEPFYGFGYDISINTLLGNACGIPPTFRYSQGDSIILISDYEIKYNLTSQEGSELPPVVEIDFEPSVFLYNTLSPIEEDLFTCSCERYGIELTGYQYRIQEGSFGLLPCESADFGGGYLFRFELGDEHFFPFEYRPLGTLENWEIELPADVQLAEAKITFLRYQDGSDVLNEEIIIPTVNGNNYGFDLENYQMPTLDEGFIFLFQHRFENECNLVGNLPFLVDATISFAPNLPEPEILTILHSEENALRVQQPALNLDTLVTCDISFDNKNRWSLSLQNESELNSENTAYNVWVYATSSTGLLTDFQLLHGVAGDIFPVQNGIWQLGNIDPEVSFPLELIANNSSCVLENVELHFGWNCEQYDDLNNEPCFSQVLPLKGISPPGEIAINEESPLGAFSLCDTISYFEMEIFNADLGAVCNPNVQVVLPNGFIIVPNTTEVSFPAGSPFTAVGNPTLLNANLAEWQVNSLLPPVEENCLAGVSDSPNNSFTIRFKAITTCDFPSGSRLQYFTSGEQTCGDATNISTELSDEIFILGADAPYSSTISSPSPSIEIACEDNKNILVSFSTSALTLAGDSIYIYLPNGVNYVPNSYQAGTNASLTEPIISSNGNGIILQSELAQNINQVDFTFDISGLSELECEAKFIQIQTLSHANALCLVDNQSCVVPVLTGDMTVPLNFNRPSFSLNDFQVNTGSNNNVNYSIQVENTGATTNQATIVDFYANGNLLYADTITIDIGTTVLTGNFNLGDQNICDVLAIIDAERHCACSVDETQITEPIFFDTQFMDTICSGEIINIGVSAITSNNYEWQGNIGNLDCDICPMTAFSYMNESQNPISFTFSLIENNGAGCTIEYSSFDIVVLPIPSILSSETEICEGDCATIIASPANSYLWNCGDFADPTLQIQEVCPVSTSDYCVTITDDFGCVGEDEVTIVVNEVPIANAGTNQSFCPEQLPQLNAQIGEDYSYLWTPTTEVDNADISNPLVTTNEITTFELTVFANGCESMDEVTISFGEDPITNVSSNATTICQTSSAQLLATGGETYEWIFDESLSCIDCPNPAANPSTETTYYVLITNAAGCFALDSILIDVEDDEIINQLDAVAICEGENYDFEGQILTEAGSYCDTFQIDGSCDSLVCLTLSVFERADTTQNIQTICAGDSIPFEGNTYNTSGEYCFEYQTVNGCDSVSCLFLTVEENIFAEIFPIDTTLLVGESVMLNVTTGFDTYVWSPSETLGCSNCPNPVASPTETTTYQVTIIDEDGCERSLEMTVTVATDCDISEAEVPNVFTPNGDDINDTFTLVSTSKLLEINNFEIYNRWGELMYSGNGENAVWDGNFKGKPAVADVYIYLIEARCLGEENFTSFKGDVSLVR